MRLLLPQPIQQFPQIKSRNRIRHFLVRQELKRSFSMSSKWALRAYHLRALGGGFSTETSSFVAAVVGVARSILLWSFTQITSLHTARVGKRSSIICRRFVGSAILGKQIRSRSPNQRVNADALRGARRLPCSLYWKYILTSWPSNSYLRYWQNNTVSCNRHPCR